MKLVKRILIIGVPTTGLVALALYLLQDRIIFRSSKLDREYAYNFDHTFEEHFITTPDGEVINALWFSPAGPSKGLVIYFHGNASNLSRWGRYAGDFTTLGYEVLMMDYRGYGKSTGSPGEDLMYADADLLLEWAKARTTLYPDKVGAGRLIIYGRSLGSAVASHLAMRADPDILILETPFDELKGAAPAAIRPLLAIFPLRSVFPNNDHMTQVKCRKVIFHGTNDRVVPLSSAEKLKPLVGSIDDFVVITGGTHRNLRTFDVYKQKLADLLR